MRYYYDTEFKEDGKTIDLISIGIVAEDGREFYAVSNEFDTRRVARDNWLMTNVMSSIEHEAFVVTDFLGAPLVRDLWVTDKARMDRDEIRDGIVDFVGKDKNSEFWAWYGDYDHVALCQLFGRMIDLPSKMPKFTMDLKQIRTMCDNCWIPEQPKGLHNALDDARFNVVRYDYLQSQFEKRYGRRFNGRA